MIPVNLLFALKAEVEDAVKDYKMAAENQDDKKVTVYAQHIPDDDFEDDTFYPLVLVSVQSGEDNQNAANIAELSTVTVGLTFGVFGEDRDAWMDLLNLMECVRQHLLKRRTINNKHRLVLPTKWETIEVQPYPFWFGYGTLKYTVAQPQEESDIEMGITKI
ncbi:MAG: hypothetical protein II767_01780 [Proteobacteria bacterium]|nr:hypothetical protein [Pseudomonadota bacterium]